MKIQPGLDADILIVGAGPAGATAACHLAGSGYHVILLDQRAFPRDKVCGDFVGPVALVELRRLGITGLDEYRRTNVIREAALYLDGRALIRHPIPEIDGLPANGRVIPRMVLDDMIFRCARRAGVDIREATRVTAVAPGDGGVDVTVRGPEGERTLRGKVVMGADGSGSIVARTVRGPTTPKKDRIVAVRAYFEDVSGPEDLADLYFTSRTFPGYYWLFPAGRGAANVGVGILRETFPPAEEHLRDLLAELVESDRTLRERLGSAALRGKVVGWPLPTYNPATPMVADSMMLLGDAAGLINPLNGEGIQYAMLSGRWAAETAGRCLRRGDVSRPALEAYAARVRREMRYDMALAGMIIELIRNRHLNPLWLHALEIITTRAKTDPEYARITGGVLAGLIPSSAALDPDIILRTVRQAAMSEGFSIARHAFRGPGHWSSAGRQSAAAVTGLAWQNLRRPGGLVTWGAGLVLSGIELAGQVGTQVASRLAGDGNAPGSGIEASGEAPTVRVRSYKVRSPE